VGCVGSVCESRVFLFSHHRERERGRRGCAFAHPSCLVCVCSPNKKRECVRLFGAFFIFFFFFFALTEGEDGWKNRTRLSLASQAPGAPSSSSASSSFFSMARARSMAARTASSSALLRALLFFVDVFGGCCCFSFFGVRGAWRGGGVALPLPSSPPTKKNETATPIPLTCARRPRPPGRAPGTSPPARRRRSGGRPRWRPRRWRPPGPVCVCVCEKERGERGRMKERGREAVPRHSLTRPSSARPAPWTWRRRPAGRPPAGRGGRRRRRRLCVF
jgi:hypothetical protein